MKRKILIIAVATALGAGTALAAPPPGKGGGKPGGGETTLGNNLSQPTLFVGTIGMPVLRIPCTAAPQAPGVDGVVPTYLFEGALYWTQKSEATWSGSCRTGVTGGGVLPVTADWGDNLTGDGRLSAGRPIRVEMRLIANAYGETGILYNVIKLTPELDDRLSTYGTKGDSLGTSYGVWEEEAKLRIEKCLNTDCDSVQTVLPDTVMSAEINSTGAVVYGYNWGIKSTGGAENGTYRLTFTPKSVQITNAADARAGICTGAGANCSYVYITVGTSGGGRPPGKGGGE